METRKQKGKDHTILSLYMCVWYKRGVLELSARERFQIVVQGDGPHEALLLIGAGFVVLGRPATDEAHCLLLVLLILVQRTATVPAAQRVVMMVVIPVNSGAPSGRRSRLPLARQSARIFRIFRVWLGVARPAAAASPAASTSSDPPPIAADEEDEAEEDGQTAGHGQPDDEGRR